MAVGDQIGEQQERTNDPFRQGMHYRTAQKRRRQWANRLRVFPLCMSCVGRSRWTLLSQQLLSQQLFDKRQQLVELHRLGVVLRAAGLDRSFSISRHRVRR